MPFEKIPGLPGYVYVPEQNPDMPKKNNCPDCFSCQFCSDDRCQVCLGEKNDSQQCKWRHKSGNDDETENI